MKNINPILFKYLEKENISIDKTEYEFQSQSHPDYPALLSTVDTLTFFNIKNGAMKIEKSEIDFLPDYFIAYLNVKLEEPKLFFVERRDEKFELIENKKSSIIDKDEFMLRWKDIVLLIEKDEEESTIKSEKNNKINFLLLFAFLIFLSLIYISKPNWSSTIFFIFPITGILFSIAALKDLVGVKSKIINEFCNITVSTSCETLVNSSKWKFFKIFNFSDLSIVFFSGQFISLFLSILINNTTDFLNIQKLLLSISIPVILLSLYYQKFVEKKWCPICLVIISIIISEIVYLNTLINFKNFTFNSILLVCFPFLITLTIWQPLKKLLTYQNKAKNDLFKATRFERNYENFKNNLLAQQHFIFPDIPIVLGNKNSNTIITIITNPFCGHCKNVHKIIDQILHIHNENIRVEIIFKTDFEKQNEEAKNLFRTLYSVYDYDNQSKFLLEMKKWFEKSILKDWIENLDPNSIPVKDFDNTLIFHNTWCFENKLNFTPAIFLNGHIYPKTYNRNTLIHFMNDFIEDNF